MVRLGPRYPGEKPLLLPSCSFAGLRLGETAGVMRIESHTLGVRSVTAIVESGHRQSQEARRPTNYQFIEEKGAHKRTHPPVFSSRLTAFSSKELPFSIALWLTEPGELH